MGGGLDSDTSGGVEAGTASLASAPGVSDLKGETMTYEQVAEIVKLYKYDRRDTFRLLAGYLDRVAMQTEPEDMEKTMRAVLDEWQRAAEDMGLDLELEDPK